jgi:phospholipid/cholesterol/gamma-HCH transport system ATP-binding protein
MKNIISLRDIIYPAVEPWLLDSVSADIPEGLVTVVLGPSGSGKSVLLKVMGGIIDPVSGQILMDDVDIATMSEEEIKTVRRRISFVFQDGGLLSNLSVKENLLLPVNFHFPDLTFTDKNNLVNDALKKYNIEHTLNKRPSEISSANRKIIAFIRAELTDPDVLLVDEPVANLDASSRKRILHDLLESKKQGKTIVLVTQSQDVLNLLVDYMIIFNGGNVMASGLISEIVKDERPHVKKILDDYMMSTV